MKPGVFHRPHLLFCRVLLILFLRSLGTTTIPAGIMGPVLLDLLQTSNTKAVPYPREVATKGLDNIKEGN